MVLDVMVVSLVVLGHISKEVVLLLVMNMETLTGVDHMLLNHVNITQPAH